MLEALNNAVQHARALWRFRWQCVLVAWVVCLLGWAYVLNVPDVYESTARVYVDTRTALRPMLEGLAVEQDVESDLFRVRQALLSGPHLKQVAHDTGLDARVKDPSAQFALVENLRNDIKISADSRNADSVYTISYRNPNRQISLKVVQLLVTTFVQDTLGGKHESSEEAQAFLKEQLKGYQNQLAVAEDRLAKFKRDKLGLLPGAAGDYFTRLNAEMAAEKQAEANLAIAYGRRAELTRQLSGSRPYVPGTTTGETANRPSSDISVRRMEAESRLQELLLRYTDKHPEVIALKATIEELKQREQTELAEIAKGGTGTGAIRSLNANPVYQNIQVQLNQTEVEISALNAAIAQHKSEIVDLRRMVDTAPAVEQELAQLNRDYEVTKNQYNAFLTRLEKARVTDDADRTGVMKFEVMDPATTRPKPVSPPRFVLMMAVLAIGLGAGIAWGFGRQVIHPTFLGAASLASATGLPVVGAITACVTQEARGKEHGDFFRLSLATCSLIVVALILAVLSTSVYRLVHGLAA